MFDRLLNVIVCNGHMIHSALVHAHNKKFKEGRLDELSPPGQLARDGNPHRLCKVIKKDEFQAQIAMDLMSRGAWSGVEMGSRDRAAEGRPRTQRSRDQRSAGSRDSGSPTFFSPTSSSADTPVVTREAPAPAAPRARPTLARRARATPSGGYSDLTRQTYRDTVSAASCISDEVAAQRLVATQRTERARQRAILQAEESARVAATAAAAASVPVQPPSRRSRIRLLDEASVLRNLPLRLVRVGMHYPLEVNRRPPKFVRGETAERGAKRKRAAEYEHHQPRANHYCQWCRYLLRVPLQPLAKRKRECARRLKAAEQEGDADRVDAARAEYQEVETAMATLRESTVGLNAAAASCCCCCCFLLLLFLLSLVLIVLHCHYRQVEEHRQQNVLYSKRASCFCSTCQVYVCVGCWGRMHQITVSKNVLNAQRTVLGAASQENEDDGSDSE